MTININPNPNIKDFSYGRKFVRGLASRSIAPVILLEAFVEGGRTYQAYKRGGFTEARERLTEEMIGAIFWFSGVPLFNKLIDKGVGEKLFKLPETNFDTGKDSLRNPVKNYISKFQKQLAMNPEKAEKMIAKYKFGKVLTSILLANGLVGLVLPKVNQGITKHLMKKNAQEVQPKEQEQTSTSAQNSVQEQYTIDKFLNKDDKFNVAFGMNPQTLMSLAYNFENNPKYGLLATDLGVWIGRGTCARNKYERTEVLFRDITSSYFYMFNMPVIAWAMNKLQGIQSGKRLDPVAAQQVTEHMNEVLKVNGGTMKSEAFKEFVLGNPKNAEFITPIEDLLKQNNDVIKLDQFIERLPEIKSKYPQLDVDKIARTAKGMSELQPAAYKQVINADDLLKILVDEKIQLSKNIVDMLNNIGGEVELDNLFKSLQELKANNSADICKTVEKAIIDASSMKAEKVITRKQILDVFTDGAINMPEFLKNIFKISTSDQNLFTGKVSKPTFDSDLVFISKETFEKKQKELVDYVETIIKKAKNGEITKELLKKVDRQNYTKNALNWGVGFAISAAFLSTFIPKIQYWITRKATGSNAFPGTADYSQDSK